MCRTSTGPLISPQLNMCECADPVFITDCYNSSNSCGLMLTHWKRWENNFLKGPTYPIRCRLLVTRLSGVCFCTRFSKPMTDSVQYVGNPSGWCTHHRRGFFSTWDFTLISAVWAQICPDKVLHFSADWSQCTMCTMSVFSPSRCF